MIIHHTAFYLVKNKKEIPKDARNLPPTLKGRGKKKKYKAPVVRNEIRVESVCIGTAEEVMASEFYLKRCLDHKEIPYEKGQYRIERVEFLSVVGETAWDRPHTVAPEKLKPWPNPWPGDPDFDIKKHGYKEEKKYVRESIQNNQSEEKQQGIYGNNSSAGPSYQPEKPAFTNFPKPKFSK